MIAALLIAQLLGTATAHAAVVRNVCVETPEALDEIRQKEAARIADVYANTQSSQFRLDGGACEWRCQAPERSPRQVCFTAWKDFLAYSCNRPTRKLGRAMDDDEYFRWASARWRSQRKDMMAPPTDLVSALNGAARTKSTDFKSRLRDLGYKYVQYTSTSVGGPDGTGNKLLIYVEGQEYDQWVQVAINSTTPETLGEQVDFIAVEKQDPASAKSLVKPNIYFKEYSRAANGLAQSSSGAHGGTQTRALTRCTGCHASGLRSVIPDPKRPVEAYPSNSLAVFQTRMANTPMNPNLGYVPARDGPVMGRADRPETERVRLMALTSCAGNGRSADSLGKIARAMNCQSCHNGTYRGLLNAGTDLSTLRHKVAAPEGALPDRARMPPPGEGDTLDADERTALAACLRAEYAADLKKWLMETKCTVDSNKLCPDGTVPLGSPEAPAGVRDAIRPVNRAMGIEPPPPATE